MTEVQNVSLKIYDFTERLIKTLISSDPDGRVSEWRWVKILALFSFDISYVILKTLGRIFIRSFDS